MAKSGNGAAKGLRLSLEFNLENEDERHAWVIYQRFAKDRSFKMFIVSFLCAVWALENVTKQTLSMQKMIEVLIMAASGNLQGQGYRRPSDTEGIAPPPDTALVGTTITGDPDLVAGNLTGSLDLDF